MANLLDANCFIESNKRWYGIDFCPAFWSWLELQNAMGQLFSIDKIQDELLQVNDELQSWAQARGGSFFLPVDTAALNCYSRIAQWVQSSSIFAPQHKTKFLSKADPWLISFAWAHGHTVVTEEKMVPSNATTVKIPNVCNEFGVPCCDLVPIIRASGARFDLR